MLLQPTLHRAVIQGTDMNLPAVAAPSTSATGLRTAVRIMERWGATQDEIARTLRVSRSSVSRAKGRLESISLDDDQLDRISYVLNIHAALRMMFDNPENVEGFMSMANHNAFFNGRTPLEVITGGSYVGLYETFRRIDGLRGGMW